MENLNIVYLPVDSLTPYEKNARKHNDINIKSIKESIAAFGMNDPIGIWGEKNIIIEGHGRVIACKELGITEVPCIRLDHLTDEQRRAYTLAHNKTAELADWDFDTLNIELEGITDIDMSLFGFSDDIEIDDISEHLRNAMENGERDEEYNEFVEKFKPKLTTDDCYTPPLVYEAVKDWTVNEYGWQGRKIVRPFYPGGDYTDLKQYGKNSVVIDNPPFSIISQIAKFYAEHNIDYFLFAPHLTVFSIRAAKSHLCVGESIIYDNGANVMTSYICSQGACVRTAPTLNKAVKEAVIATAKENAHTELPNYIYPVNVLTSCTVAQWSDLGVDYQEENCSRISILDSQKEQGKAIFGGGYLVPEAGAKKAAELAKKKAAELAEKKAAELAKKKAAELAEKKAKAIVWELSDREKKIIEELTNR